MMIDIDKLVKYADDQIHDFNRIFDPVSRELLKAVKQLQNENKELREAYEWISVKDRLPELETMVVCYGLNTEDNALCGEVFFDLGEREQEGFSIEPYSLNGYTTHWKPLPKPPEVKQ